jgi:hypothetical protein
MSLALPLFTDLTKASQDVLHGNVQGEGVFTSGAQAKAQTVTAGVSFGACMDVPSTHMTSAALKPIQ